jgi:zinc protease
VVVVGDVDAKTLAGMLDQIFGGLPAKAKLTPVAQTMPRPSRS